MMMMMVKRKYVFLSGKNNKRVFQPPTAEELEYSNLGLKVLILPKRRECIIHRINMNSSCT